MAGNDGQERTEQATPKRLREAREKGQIARSRELTTLAMLMTAAGALLILGPTVSSGLMAQMRLYFQQDIRQFSSSPVMTATVIDALKEALLLLVPLLAPLLLVALLAPLALGGWTFSLGFKWERVNPAKGLGRLLSWRALMELAKALAKFILVAGFAVTVLWHKQPTLLQLSNEPLPLALVHAAELLGWIFLILILPMLLIAGVDVPFQLFEHARQLRMTRQEVRDEMKDTEGKPEVKGRIRRLQQEFAQRRMMEKLPSADVIITNPTHYAVALKYDQATMSAPLVIAKGVDLIALRIRAVAVKHAIPQVESPLLARALYFNSDLDQPIPPGLYLAVAQVLAYLYELRCDSALGDSPITMTDVPIPPEFRK